MTPTITLTVQGMSCGHCVKAVTAAIQAKDPNAKVEVDLADGTVKARPVIGSDGEVIRVIGTLAISRGRA